MYNDETNFLLLMLGISDTQYREALYSLSEKWEDRNQIWGLYAHKQFRNWWIMRANGINKPFFDRVNYSGNEMILHISDQKGKRYFYRGKDDIRRQFFNNLRRLVNTPFDTSLLQLIDFKTQKVKQS